MRLAHLADLHLGFRQYQRLTERGRNQREVDVGVAFSRAIDGIVAARPDIVIVAGDIFHAVRPTNSAILLAFREFSRLRAALPEVPVVLIAGNHDTPRSSETTSIFGLFVDLGMYVASIERAQRFEFPELDLELLAVPHAALLGTPRPAFERSETQRYHVMTMHGEVPGLFKTDPEIAESGGAMIEPEEWRQGKWDYVALGHYHVQREIAERVWYSGALDYVSPNAWGELHEEERLGVPGKGWLMVDLDSGAVTRHPIAVARRVLDLPSIDAKDLGAEDLDRLLVEAVENAPGGIRDAVVRLVVRNVPRPVAREIDHARVRAWKAEALHFLLDLRRPVAILPASESGAPGVRRTLPEVLRDSLTNRPLPASVDREQFVQEGMSLLDVVTAASGES